MATIPTVRLPADGRYSLADLEAMPEDGLKYELIGGSIVMNPPPVMDHQRTTLRLTRLLEEACPNDFEVFHELGLKLADGQFCIPDIGVVAPHHVGPKYAHGAVLAVEVVSPGSRHIDYRAKVAVYAESGVEHYWIVDASKNRVVCHELDPTTGEYVVTLDAVGEVTTIAPVAITFEVERLATR